MVNEAKLIYTLYTPCIMFQVTFYLPTINAKFFKLITF